MSALRAQYEANTTSLYTFFDASLQQTACNTTSSARYSLVRNCTDCARDYKNWLCAVTIPRCTDFSDSSSYLIPRNIGNKFANGSAPTLPDTGEALNSSMTNITRFTTSRNPFIDDTIVPQPYNELMPCKELCYELVKSCPAALGFQCPVTDVMMSRSYGTLDTTALEHGVVTCNYPGVDVPDMLGAAAGLAPTVRLAMAVAVTVMGLMLLS
jgi:calcium channel MID1